MRNPRFNSLLDKMREVHEAKNSDYASDDNPYSNFEYSARVSEIFTDPVDRVFTTIIGVKLARIAELRKGKTPRNEPIDDSFLDLANYSAIWASYRRSLNAGKSKSRSKVNRKGSAKTRRHL